MKLAVEIAKKVNGKRYNFVAIITDSKNRILSIGINSYNKTHPMQQKYADKDNQHDKIYLHAEIDALVKCKKVPFAIYVARVNKSGQVRMAKPCSICERAILESGIKEIRYTK